MSHSAEKIPSRDFGIKKRPSQTIREENLGCYSLLLFTSNMIHKSAP